MLGVHKIEKKYRALCDCTFDGDVKQHRYSRM